MNIFHFFTPPLTVKTGFFRSARRVPRLYNSFIVLLKSLKKQRKFAK